MAQQIIPNQFDLQGTGVRIVFSTSSIAGKAQLSFTKGRKTLNFSGNEINRLDTKIGTLVTVTIATTPDRSTTTFSFLVPAINLSKSSAQQAFRTIGITTVHKTSIAGPPTGVQQVYTSVPLRGTARQVQFLAKTASA